MVEERPATHAAPLFAAAVLSYLANCGLGAAVASKVIDTSGSRWLHHALFIATCTTTAAAISSALWGVPRTRNRRAAFALMPAVVPLALIPFLGTWGRRHPLVALSAAPFFVAGLSRAIAPEERK